MIGAALRKLWGAHAPRPATAGFASPRRTDEGPMAVSWFSTAREDVRGEAHVLPWQLRPAAGQRKGDPPLRSVVDARKLALRRLLALDSLNSQLPTLIPSHPARSPLPSRRPVDVARPTRCIQLIEPP